jgi:V/A-type H+-transporting ATPase subunit I
MYVLSACTIVWGAASGNWFGAEAIANLPVVKHLTIPALASFDYENGGFNNNEMFMIGLCFKIGAVHLVLAHTLAFMKKLGSPRCLAEAGWVGVICGLYFVTGKLVLERPLPTFALYLIGIGAFMALLFTNYQKNVLKGVGETIIELPLGLIAAFSDIVSYLRLFAVGYASLVLANTFNSMAASVGMTMVMAELGAALILFLGHTLNIILATMGVVVHGVRLKMLEFSGHVGNEWSGMAYEPFKDVCPYPESAKQ